MRACVSWLVPSLLLACAGGDDGTDDDPPLSATGGQDVAAPTFIEPASGMLTLSSTRHTDVVLQVADIDPARTKLLVDGVSFGELDADDPFGTLSLDAFTLRLRGAMVPGSHRLLLQTTTSEALLASEEIVIEVAAADSPRVEAEPGQPQLDARVVAGFSRDVIVALDDRAPRRSAAEHRPARHRGLGLGRREDDSGAGLRTR